MKFIEFFDIIYPEISQQAAAVLVQNADNYYKELEESERADKDAIEKSKAEIDKVVNEVVCAVKDSYYNLLR